MRIPVVKKLVENTDLETLKKAEQAFEEGEEPGIEVEGEDEGEQFTHVIAAAWILEKMQNEGEEFKTTLRAYTQKIRQSIS